MKIVGDITHKNVCEKIVKKTVEKFGRLTTLVNNAAVFKLNTIKNMKIEDYDSIMSVNLKPVIMLVQESLPYLISEKGFL